MVLKILNFQFSISYKTKQNKINKNKNKKQVSRNYQYLTVIKHISWNSVLKNNFEHEASTTVSYGDYFCQPI